MAAKLSVLISEDEADRFTCYCQERGYKKSTLVARLIHEHLEREGYPDQRSLFIADQRRAH
ncbi:hypothetical protein [Novosphingobium sp.]|uniref:hypothetical protein n=1 Tax=Novosphingobium sp. TaxID=1874826 RepID=UPI0026116859|nr:hypothetical protein [Novosphingobium sp.]